MKQPVISSVEREISCQKQKNALQTPPYFLLLNCDLIFLAVAEMLDCTGDF